MESIDVLMHFAFDAENNDWRDWMRAQSSQNNERPRKRFGLRKT